MAAQEIWVRGVDITCLHTKNAQGVRNSDVIRRAHAIHLRNHVRNKFGGGRHATLEEANHDGTKSPFKIWVPFKCLLQEGYVRGEDLGIGVGMLLTIFCKM